ncbi:hypothetical protein SAMN06272789_7253 [Streptomyces sp. 1331.2]|nr:hypothetical protein SAMN06272789_7253 [Streptomyces sp. 1331.2]
MPMVATRRWHCAGESAGQWAGCSHMSTMPAIRLGQDFQPAPRASSSTIEPQRSRKASG